MMGKPTSPPQRYDPQQLSFMSAAGFVSSVKARRSEIDGDVPNPSSNYCFFWWNGERGISGWTGLCGITGREITETLITHRRYQKNADSSREQIRRDRDRTTAPRRTRRRMCTSERPRFRAQTATAKAEAHEAGYKKGWELRRGRGGEEGRRGIATREEPLYETCGGVWAQFALCSTYKRVLKLS